MRQTRVVRVLVLAVLAAALVVGALQLAFLCDDAFITFRYVSNAHDGLGLVWNPPPFQPVEGYTGFLWALLLWATWSWFGVAPPAAANVLSIACGVGQFAIVAAAALRLRGRDGARLPDAVGLLTLAAIVGNRTFLQWMTSGLETALFNAAFVGWVLHAFRTRERRHGAWLAIWSTAAAVAALARPDGYLLVAATAAVAVVSVVQRERSARRAMLGLLPLLAVVAHVLWRHSFYGEWLPNTYYAKVVDPWPEAGLRYFACFAFENSVWIWLPIALAWSVTALRRGLGAMVHALLAWLPAVATVVAVLFHVGYYILRVGGDPFEYRVLSHLIAPAMLAAVSMAAQLRRGITLPIVCACALGLGCSIGWVQLALTEPQLTLHYVPLAPKLPRWLQPVWHWHDRYQAWLHAHVICGRCHQHALFLAASLAELPARARTTADANDIPVAEFRGVGAAGWVLPDCAVLDVHGLNDWVAARTPVPKYTTSWLPRESLQAVLQGADKDGDHILTRRELEASFAAVLGSNAEVTKDFVGHLLLLFADRSPDSMTSEEAAGVVPFFTELRFMAHQRNAPVPYLAAFDPNVTIKDRQVVVRKRDQPLTADRVRAIEQEWRERIEKGLVR